MKVKKTTCDKHFCNKWIIWRVEGLLKSKIKIKVKIKDKDIENYILNLFTVVLSIGPALNSCAEISTSMPVEASLLGFW